MKILDVLYSPYARRRLLCLVACLFAVQLMAACATKVLTSGEQVAELGRLIRAHDYEGASDLIRRYPESLDDKRGLSVAVRVGDAEGVKYFAKRVGVDAKLDLDDTTALIDSVTRAPPAARVSVARTLLELGADPDREDKFGHSAGSLAERRNETALLEMMDRYVNTPKALGPSRMLSWFPANRKVSLLAQNGGGTSLDSSPLPIVAPGKGRKNAARSGPAAPQAPVPSSPSFLVRSVWLPAPEAGRNAPLAAFRFHIDGTGELLRYVPRDKRSETVAGASLAWEFTGGKLRFFVLGDEFSALCESASLSDGRVDISCTDYSRAVGQAATGATGEARFDNARVLLDRQQGRRLALRNAPTVATELMAGTEPGCRAKPGAQVVSGGSAKRNVPAADWFAFSVSRFEAVSPLSGMACRPAEAEKRAMADCRKGSRDCRSVPGCAAGEVSAVAALAGHTGAWVGCDTDLKEARRKALESCRATAGCDCTLIAMNGQNINLARQPVCGR